MMRIRSFAAGIALVLVSAAAPAHAGVLAAATWTEDFFGSLATVPSFAITVTNAGATCTDTNPFHIPGAGFVVCPTAGLQPTGGSTGTSYNVSLTMPLFQMQAFTTGGQITLGTRVSLSGTQQIVGNAFSATGTPGVLGMVTVGGGMHDMLSHWSQPAGGTLVVVPLVIGKQAHASWTFTVLGSTHDITVDFYGWTPGTLTFTGLTSQGMSLRDVVAMGSFALDPSGPDEGAGTVTLVAPAKMSIDGLVVQRRTVALASLKLTFVPEPTILLLLGAGALALLGFRGQP